jgi:hypothetical protein
MPPSASPSTVTRTAACRAPRARRARSHRRSGQALRSPHTAPQYSHEDGGARSAARTRCPALADLHAGHADLLFAELVDARGAVDAPAEVALPPDPAGLRTAMVIDDAYRIAVPAEWPAFAWLGDGTIATELGRRPCIASPRDTARRDALERLARTRGSPPAWHTSVTT